MEEVSADVEKELARKPASTGPDPEFVLLLVWSLDQEGRSRVIGSAIDGCTPSLPDEAPLEVSDLPPHLGEMPTCRAHRFRK